MWLLQVLEVQITYVWKYNSCPQPNLVLGFHFFSPHCGWRETFWCCNTEYYNDFILLTGSVYWLLKRWSLDWSHYPRLWLCQCTKVPEPQWFSWSQQCQLFSFSISSNGMSYKVGKQFIYLILYKFSRKKITVFYPYNFRIIIF